MSSKVVTSLAKVFDAKSVPVVGKPGKQLMEAEGYHMSFALIQSKIESLSDKMDMLIHIQEKVLHRLDGLSQDIVGIEKDMETLKVDKEEIHLQPPKQQNVQIPNEMREMCQEMTSIISTVSQRSEQHAKKLEGMERLVMGIQQVIGFIGETVKSSWVTELLVKDPAARKARTASAKLREHRGLAGLKGLKSHRKKKPPDTPEIAALRKQAQLLEEVQSLNRLNAERLGQVQPRELWGRVGGALEDESNPALNIILEAPCTQAENQVTEQKCRNVTKEKMVGRDKPLLLIKDTDEDDKKKEEPVCVRVCDTQIVVKEEVKLKKQADTTMIDDEKPSDTHETESRGSITESAPRKETFHTNHSYEKTMQAYTQLVVVVDRANEVTSCGKCDVTDGDFEKDKNETACVKEVEKEQERVEVSNTAISEQLEEDVEEKELSVEDETEESEQEYFIDCSPPPSATFSHRIVSVKPNQISNFYTINRQEILGGGRFGQVHKCIENSSGLTFAAKVIKAKCQKEKDFVKTEIQMMNQLDHANLIQLYAAYESKTDIILVLEYVDGGELFDRIIDENYKLTELDSVMFIRQICEGLQYMHKMWILHLDLKPENIMCVSRVTNKIKIIDFGLARKFHPKEKLKVTFGTPEFLAPEVINYEYVSFSTDMWSLGVITYMLLSSLSPFLGDDNNQTLNNILACQWNFEEVEFADISEEAKDFIAKLLVVNKSWRISASEALRHAWLSDPLLHHRLHKKKNMCRSRRSSCVPLIET